MSFYLFQTVSVCCIAVYVYIFSNRIFFCFICLIALICFILLGIYPFNFIEGALVIDK